MANYLYFQYDQDSLLNRFAAENTLGEGYEIRGRQEWETSISQLFRFLSGNFTDDFRRQILSELYEATKIEPDNQTGEVRDLGELILQLLLIRLRQAAYKLA